MSPILGILASSNFQRVTSSYESIATTTVGSGGAANVTFSSIPSTYTHLQIRYIGRTTRASILDWQDINLNGSSAANYANHRLFGDGATVTSDGYTSQTTISTSGDLSGATAGSSIFGSGFIDILDYTSTSKNKTIRLLGGFDNNGTGRINFVSGLWFATSAAITSIKLAPGSGSNYVQYSQFALYGIKGA